MLKNTTLILHNANVLTMEQKKPNAGAVVVADEKIVFVGDSGQALSYRGPRTQVIDCRKHTLLPGFNDNHVHTLGMGNFFNRPHLYGKSCAEIIGLLKREYAGVKPGVQIIGQAWDYAFCPHPDRDILDRAFPRNPVMLYQYSGHAVWVNSLMLRRLRITRKSPDPKGGLILRDEHGEPTGIIRGSVLSSSHRNVIMKRVLSPILHKELLASALERYKAGGITSVQDNTWQPLTVWLLRRFQRRGKLTCRFSCWPLGQVGLLAHTMKLACYDRFWVRKGPWKYIVDGAFSPHSAWLGEAYSGEEHNRGKAVLQPLQLARLVKQAAKHKRQAAFHAIGDRAVHEVVNAVEMAGTAYPWVPSLRFRLEHAQIIRPEDMQRIKKLGILVAAQPTALSQPEKDYALVGAERFAQLYPYNSLLKTGVNLSFGSDIPGEIEYNPLLAIERAVTRRGEMKPGGRSASDLEYDKREGITPYQALYCYTMGSAYAEFMENHKGSLVAGKLADLVLLADDPTRVPQQEIGQIPVLLTVVGGRIVYENQGLEI